MPSKKKKFNARFPPARIKKIMQLDEEVGKVATPVPVIISRALEMFVETLIKQANDQTKAKNAKTLSVQHIKQTILAERKFDFLKELVANIPDVQQNEEEKEEASHSQSGPRRRGRPRKSKDEAVPAKKARTQKSKQDSSTETEEESDDMDEDDCPVHPVRPDPPQPPPMASPPVAPSQDFPLDLRAPSRDTSKEEVSPMDASRDDASSREGTGTNDSSHGSRLSHNSNSNRSLPFNPATTHPYVPPTYTYSNSCSARSVPSPMANRDLPRVSPPQLSLPTSFHGLVPSMPSKLPETDYDALP